jgi:N-acetylmuramoyl-L-alanine amidase
MDVTRRSFALFGATALGGVALSGRAWADVPAAIRGVRVSADDASALVRLELDRQASARTFFLSNPHRFVIDVANAHWAMPQGPFGQGAGQGVVRAYRFAPRPDGVSRLVLDLTSPLNLVRQELGTRRAPQLSFGLGTLTPVAFRPAQPLEIDAPARSSRRRVIVVDPGHGGHDPGAIGVSGVQEKDVVLDAGKRLRAALESRGGYRVAMTRDDDRFIALADRVAFARAQNADLFISLHADSSPNREACGASVYTLSDHGANRAQNLITAQNWDLDLGAAPRHGVVGDILVDLAQRETTNRSAQFAELVIARLGQVSPLLVSSHRNAGFFVLLAPDVPAVLIETGFLTNRADEASLGDARQRQAVACAIADAVDVYFQTPQIYAGA